MSLITGGGISDNIFKDVESMKSANFLKAGRIAKTTDYYSTQRGGGASYLVKTTAQASADGDVIDGHGNHAIAGGLLVAVLQVEDEINISQFGAVGDGATSDVGAIQSALNAGWSLKGVDGKKYLLDAQVGFRDNDFYTGDKQTISNAHFVLDYATYPVFTSLRSIGDELSTDDLFAGPIALFNCNFTQINDSTAINLDRVYNLLVDGCTIDGLHQFGLSEIGHGPLSGGYSQSCFITNSHISRIGNSGNGGAFFRANVAINTNISDNFFEYCLGLIVDIPVSAQSLRVCRNSIEGGQQTINLWNATGTISDNYFENTNMIYATPDVDGVVSEIFIDETFGSVQRTNLVVSGNRFHSDANYVDDSNYVPVRCGSIAFGDTWNIDFKSNNITRATTLAQGSRPLITTRTGRVANYHMNSVTDAGQKSAVEEQNMSYKVQGMKYSKEYPLVIPNKIKTEVKVKLKGSGALNIKVIAFTQSEASLSTAEITVSVVGDLENITLATIVSQEEVAGSIFFDAPTVANGELIIPVVSAFFYMFGYCEVSGVGNTNNDSFTEHYITDEQDMTFIERESIIPAQPDVWLNDIGQAINTTGKILNKEVYNYDQKITVYASGPLASDPWNDQENGGGTVINTPT